MFGNITRKLSLDALGIGASFACAVHCALLPLVMTALPLVGLELFENDAVEYVLLGGSFLIGLLALYRGYYRHHHSMLPGVLFIIGFMFLLAGHFLPVDRWEPLVILCGASLIIAAHVRNLRECRRCKH